MGKLGCENKNTPKASRKPTTNDIYWAAGFLEGEGNFQLGPRNKLDKGKSWGQPQLVTCTQRLDGMENLEYLQDIFGGSIREYDYSDRTWSKPFAIWRACGPRARGIALTLYCLLSSRRREQVGRMIEEKV